MIESIVSNRAREWSAVAALLVLSGCKTVEGSGHVVSEERAVEDFDRVSLRGRGTIHFTQGPEQQLLIEAEDNIINRLVTRVEDHKLILRERENVILDPSEPIRFHITAPLITRVVVEGSGRFVTSSLEVPRLSLEIDGSGKAEVFGLAADELEVDVDGSGRLTVAGEVGTQVVEVDASGRYEALGLKSARADLDVDGSGEATVHADDELHVHVDGSGHVDYQGDPAVTSDVDGSGRLHAID